MDREGVVLTLMSCEVWQTELIDWYVTLGSFSYAMDSYICDSHGELIFTVQCDGRLSTTGWSSTSVRRFEKYMLFSITVPRITLRINIIHSMQVINKSISCYTI